ncbi:hypothetical protein [Cryptosporangium phraense]|uniref:hypothetical protein n=1 Tax=Cryptosporangium phraense TaxID=2593070 RepID=UPI001478D2A4|nr:hypothetical protein [Cryptosporangium phraense]
MAEPSGAHPMLPAPPPVTVPNDPAAAGTVEDGVLASWIEVLIADGLVPGLILPPL